MIIMSPTAVIVIKTILINERGSKQISNIL